MKHYVLLLSEWSRILSQFMSIMLSIYFEKETIRIVPWIYLNGSFTFEQRTDVKKKFFYPTVLKTT